MPHDNQKVTLKIGPLVCTPPEELQKTPLMLKFDEIEANLEDLTKLTGLEAQFNETLKELRDEIEYVKEDASNNLIQHIQILKSNMQEEIQASTAVFDTKFNEIENAAQDDLMNELEQRVETQFNETLRELRDEIDYVKEDASNNCLQSIQILKSNMQDEIQASAAVLDTKFDEEHDKINDTLNKFRAEFEEGRSFLQDDFDVVSAVYFTLFSICPITS